MSVQQSLAAGLIGLVVAGAGGVGVYNFATTGCFLGSCSSETTADKGETAQVGLLVAGAESDEAGDSCCPLGDGASKLEAVALDTAGEACEGPESCAHPEGKLTLVAGEAGADACCGCGACGTEKAPEASTIEAALPSDD